MQIQRISGQVPTVNSHSKSDVSFNSRLIIDQNPFVQKEVQELPAAAKKGLELFKRFLSKNGKAQENVKLYCADDLKGYDPKPTYWGLQIKSEKDMYFSRPEALHIKFFEDKKPKEVAKSLVESYNKLVKKHVGTKSNMN
jgi:hypothetical protein